MPDKILWLGGKSSKHIIPAIPGCFPNYEFDCAFELEHRLRGGEKEFFCFFPPKYWVLDQVTANVAMVGSNGAAKPTAKSNPY